MRTTRVATAFFLSSAVIAMVPAAVVGQPQMTISPGVLNNNNRIQVAPTPVPGVVYAGTSVECGNKTYHVTTGTKAGKCQNMYSPDGIKKIGVACQDKGNYAAASCPEGCLPSQGAGDCTIK
jgi:hypothetical protein